MNATSSKMPDFRILDRPDLPVKRMAAGTRIVVEGGTAAEMFLLKRGRVQIMLHGKPIEEVSPGGIFGEMALIDQGPRGATAMALEDCDVIPVNERLFVELVQDSPYFALDVMRTLVRRIRELDRLLAP
ncbi:MAG TPA: cyclic nucleotide-binding domain-containing protein [Bauldia sp.]|nr:cyclic nucleotide-binding domain-containing protein [Bauldia sp.]